MSGMKVCKEKEEKKRKRKRKGYEEGHTSLEVQPVSVFAVEVSLPDVQVLDVGLQVVS